MPPHMAHQGGYSETTARNMAAVTIPNQIKCKYCGKIRKPEAFSQKQLNDLRFKLLQGHKLNDPKYIPPGWIKCRTCTGQQVMELKCTVCGDTKGLEDFSKNQRSNPDNARCIVCVNIVLDTEPGMGPDDSDDDSDDSGDSNPWITESLAHGEGDDSKELSITDNVSMLSVSGETEVLGSSTGASAAIRAGKLVMSREGSIRSSTEAFEDGDWVEVDRKPAAKKPPAEGIPFTAFDSQGYGHPRVRAPSISTAPSVRDNDTASVSAASNTNKRDGGRWAKVKGSKTKPHGGERWHTDGKRPLYGERNIKPTGYEIEDDDEDDDSDEPGLTW